MTQPTIQIYLTVRGGLEAVKWYETTWNANQIMSQMAEDGERLMHATLEIFGGHIMLSDEFLEHDDNVSAPVSLNGTAVTVHINLPNRNALDKAMFDAATNGARITMPAADMPWGAYYGRLIDPFGHSWSFAAE